MEGLKEELISIAKDILIALLIIVIILGSLYAYSGRWPPMVVVESSSMSHSSSSRVGIIDTGDIVVVKRTDADDVNTYLEGRAEGYRKYGQYGDVIVYRPMGSTKRTPIIHRPIVYLEYNRSSFDIPTLRRLDYGEDWVTNQGERWRGLNGTLTITHYGFKDINVTINLRNLVGYAHSGFITMGDNNVSPQSGGHYDQRTSICPAPIKEGWIEGKARGELPWFGILKLAYMGKTRDVPANSWNYLIISLGVLIALPFIAEFAQEQYHKRYGYEKDEDDEDEDEGEGSEVEEPLNNSKDGPDTEKG